MQVDNRSPLKVLFIVNRLFEWSQNFITRELAEMHEQGAQMLIATRSIAERKDLTEREERLRKLAILLPEVPFWPWHLLRHVRVALRFRSGYGQAWRAVFSLKHHTVSKRFRSVICLFRATAIAEQVVAMKVNLIHAHFLTAPGDTAVHLSKITGIPYGGTAHAMDIYTDNSGLMGKIANAAYLSTCTAANEQYLKSLPGVDPKKITKLYHGIEIEPVAFTKEPHQPFTFMAVGRLVNKKGFQFLIEACAILRDKGLAHQLVFIGNGPLEEALKTQVANLGLASQIHFRGMVPPNEMGAVYRQADVLVAPSIIDPSGDRDGLPNVCLEAMCHGMPIVGTNVSGIPEGVVDGVNGWLVPPGNVELLAAAMAEAISTPRLFDMKKSAWQMATDHFSLKKNIRALRMLMEAHRQ